MLCIYQGKVLSTSTLVGGHLCPTMVQENASWYCLLMVHIAVEKFNLLCRIDQGEALKTIQSIVNQKLTPHFVKQRPSHPRTKQRGRDTAGRKARNSDERTEVIVTQDLVTKMKPNKAGSNQTVAVVGAVAYPFQSKEEAETFRYFVSTQTRGCQPRFAQMLTAAGTFNNCHETEIKIAMCPQAVFHFKLIQEETGDMVSPPLSPFTDEENSSAASSGMSTPTMDGDMDDGEEDMSF